MHNFDMTDVLSSADHGGKWFPLTGVKSGKLLLSADFLDELGRNSGDVLDELLKSDELNDPNNLPGRINSLLQMVHQEKRNPQIQTISMAEKNQLSHLTQIVLQTDVVLK